MPMQAARLVPRLGANAERRTAMEVQQIMTSAVVTVGPETNLRDVARLLVENDISGVPVCGAGGQLLGVLSEGDILVKEGGPRDDRSFLARLRGREKRMRRKSSAS